MAVFVPDPDSFDVEEFIELLGFELAERYRDAEDELIRELAVRAYRDLQLQSLLPDTPVRGGLTAAERARQNRILAELAAHRARAVRELQGIAVTMAERLRVSDMAEEIVRVAAEQGEAAAAARLGLARNLPTVFQTGSAAQAVGALAISLQSRLEVLNQRITRYPQDAYQRIVAFTAPNTLLGVTTSLQQQQATVRRFLRNGITGFTDVSGRNWRIGSYAEMAGRTAVNRAFNDAGQWRMQQSGINLVTIVGGFDACKRCAPWIGKILSTDGTPAGPRIIQHATEDRVVTVTVVGTIEQAKNAGWNHPNCRDRTVAYLPGLTVPQQKFEYNAEAERERERQRELEREIRAAKRDAATAPDTISRKRAERDVRDAQAKMRTFTGNTGRPRQSYREQLHFADGGKGNPRPQDPGYSTPRRPAAPTAARPVMSSMKPHEQDLYRRLQARGEVIDWLPQDKITRKPTNDFRWTSRGGFEVEAKSTQAKYQAIRNHIHGAVKRAAAQGVAKENFLIDIGGARLSRKLRTQLEAFNQRTTTTPISRLFVLDRDELVEILLRTKK